MVDSLGYINWEEVAPAVPFNSFQAIGVIGGARH